MGRQLRILIPGAVYHVTSRGYERKNIFRDDMDRNMLLKTIGEVKNRYDFKILAFVLMNNHYHFVLKTEKPNLPVIMQHLNTSYGIYFNRIKSDLINRKGRWNRGKRILMYLLSRDSGMNNAEVGRFLNGIHHSSIGKTVTRVIREMTMDKKMKEDIRVIAGKYRVKNL
jgi:REP element-mobilizing transposase RayT